MSKTEQEGGEEKQVRMNFEVDETLRNAFKSTVARQGKKVKEVLAHFMEQYFKESSKGS